MERVKNIYPRAAELLNTRKKFALATLIETHGSTPQVTGASALFSTRGLVLGTLGGGVLEREAQTKAEDCLRKGFSVVYESKLRGEVATEEALCGGRALVLIDATPARSVSVFKRLSKSLRSRQPGVLVTRILLSSTGRALIERRWLEQGAGRKSSLRNEGWPRPEKVKVTLKRGMPTLVRVRKAESGEKGKLLFFLEPIFPLPRLLIVGAGHVGQSLARLGKMLDFEVTVIDDRPEYASPARFPEADSLIVDEIDRAVQNFPISSDTYIVIVTRAHRHDAEALRACIKSQARYIGMIGSQRKVVLMRQEFLERGWATVSEFDRVHAPIGLKIGSKTVEEIAVSIAAELILVRSRIGQNPAE